MITINSSQLKIGSIGIGSIVGKYTNFPWHAGRKVSTNLAFSTSEFGDPIFGTVATWAVGLIPVPRTRKVGGFVVNPF